MTTALLTPPVVRLRSPQLKKVEGKFFVDTEADITVIRKSCVRDDVTIKADKILAINGVTQGESLNLGSMETWLKGLRCETQIVPSDFPINTHGLFGLNVLEAHRGKINALKKCLRLGELNIPFAKRWCFELKPRSQRVIYA